jgi:hypothetical protein
MKAVGLHYTVNDGFAWKRASASGLRGEPRAIAVHPDEAAIVAIATSEGLYLSRDSGERFTKAADGGQGLSAFFNLEGQHLWYGSFDGQPGLARIPLGNGRAEKIALPPLQDDAVAYIAQNPARKREYAIATFRRSVYISENAGESWSPIAGGGNAK